MKEKLTLRNIHTRLKLEAFSSSSVFVNRIYIIAGYPGASEALRKRVNK